MRSQGGWQTRFSNGYDVGFTPTTPSGHLPHQRGRTKEGTKCCQVTFYPVRPVTAVLETRSPVLNRGPAKHPFRATLATRPRLVLAGDRIRIDTIFTYWTVSPTSF